MKAVQSAMAIRRQRRRRDDALRAKNRRASHQSDHLMLSDSGDAGGSMLSLDGVHNNHNGVGGGGGRSASIRHRQMMGGITTFHVGVVFFIMGLMLLISGLVPGYANRQHQYSEEPSQQQHNSGSWNSKEGNNRNAPLLLVTGSFLILVGIALVVANRIATRREDELFSRYISRKLAPARMTHQPVSSLLQHHQTANIKSSKEESAGDVINECQQELQSPGQLESIIEESEAATAAGGDNKSTSKDQLYWTSDLAPVHHHHHHRSHHHHQSSADKLLLQQQQEEEDDNSKCNHQHVVGSSTG
jgi:hypothetical protein